MDTLFNEGWRPLIYTETTMKSYIKRYTTDCAIDCQRMARESYEVYVKMCNAPTLKRYSDWMSEAQELDKISVALQKLQRRYEAIANKMDKIGHE